MRKSEISDLKDKIKLMRGKMLTKNLINNCINKIKGYYNLRIINKLSILFNF